MILITVFRLRIAYALLILRFNLGVIRENMIGHNLESIAIITLIAIKFIALRTITSTNQSTDLQVNFTLDLLALMLPHHGSESLFNEFSTFYAIISGVIVCTQW